MNLAIFPILILTTCSTITTIPLAEDNFPAITGDFYGVDLTLDGRNAYTGNMWEYDLRYRGGGGSVNQRMRVAQSRGSGGSIWWSSAISDATNTRLNLPSNPYGAILPVIKPNIGYPPPIGMGNPFSFFKSPIKNLTGKPLRAFIRFEKHYLPELGRSTWHLNLGGKGSGVPIHWHIHRYNLFKPWRWGR